MISTHLPSIPTNTSAPAKGVGTGSANEKESLATPQSLTGVGSVSSVQADLKVAQQVSDRQVEEVSAEEAAQEERIQEEIEKQKLAVERQQISELAARDREVRAHEQAHASAGGQYAGAPSYTYERGPDGVSYAVAGEVPIDLGREATPQQTMIKADIVRKAALAPANPSPQDRSVAAKASQLKSSAQTELVALQREQEQIQKEQARAEEQKQAEEPGDVRRSEIRVEQAAEAQKERPSSRADEERDENNNNRVQSELESSIANTSPEAKRPGELLSELV